MHTVWQQADSNVVSADVLRLSDSHSSFTVLMEAEVRSLTCITPCLYSLLGTQVFEEKNCGGETGLNS